MGKGKRKPKYQRNPKPKGKFRIYSTKATREGEDEDEVQTLKEGTNIDEFVALLQKQVLVFPSPPTIDSQNVEFDNSDLLAAWIKLLDPKGSFSATFDNHTDRNIEAFNFHLKTPWDLSFSSSAQALLLSFGFEVGGDGGPRVPKPGLAADGKLLYFGLDITNSGNCTSTIQGLFDFAEVKTSFPSALAAWSVSLPHDPSDAKNKHNALWFSPVNYNQSIVRLQFSLDKDDQEKFQGYIAHSLHAFEFERVDFICRKVLTSAKSNGKTVATPKGQVLIEATCLLKPKGRQMRITAGITFFSGQYDITFMFDEEVKGNDPLSDVLAWLAECAGGNNDFSVVAGLLVQQEGRMFGDQFLLRRIKISLGAPGDGTKTRIKSFSIDIEAKATFGRSDQKDVVFLLNYAWRRGGSKLGSLKGSLWNTFDNSKERDLAPSYERINNLVPNTSDPSMTISIPKMIPGVDIENVPKNIPTEINAAYIVLNQDSISIGGTVQSRDLGAQGDFLVPQINLGWISIDGSYSWKNNSLDLKAGVMVELKPAATAKHKETATLIGTLEYKSKKWVLNASLRGLYLSSLYDFFDKSKKEGDHVIPLIEAIEIEKMDLQYSYDKAKNQSDSGSDDVVGSSFTFDGLLNVSDLQLSLKFDYRADGNWVFNASLNAGKKTSIGKVMQGLLGEDVDVPGFLYDAELDPERKDDIKLEVKKGKPAKSGDSAPFHFMASLKISPYNTHIALTFAQWHGGNWPAQEPSKRLIKVAMTGLPKVPIALVGDITQPFDEMYFMWIQDNTKQSKGKLPGITRKEKDELNGDDAFKEHPLVAKDKDKSTDTDIVVIGAGAHFAIVIKNDKGERLCLLDYDFKKQAPQSKKKSQRSLKAASGSSGGTDGKDEKNESDGNSSTAPYKKKMGPLSINNIGIKYSDKILHISFDATMELGPIALELLGFGLNIEITSLDLKNVNMKTPSLEGFAVAFEKKPLTIAGIIRHGATAQLNYYAGGLIIGWVPYQLEAAGFYGEAKPNNRAPFTSVFVFARLDGPLATLEFAEISGVTGGFGYHSEVRVPTADQVTTFPFIDQESLGSAKDALQALQQLTDPDSAKGGWFQPQDDTYWAAAGMKIDAFQMISLDAVVVVQFGTAVKLGIFGVALVDIPNSETDFKFAHVELGISCVVDFDLGIMKTEAQLSPKSFILHPSCKLSGGFALYYWFDAPHADRGNIGNFVFTLGGYHQAFRVPVGWPNPDRLKISWSLGSSLSISGEGYFAITPKICMGGGRLRASYEAGPIKAWFDAFANFLVQYQPFHFDANASICVGASFNLDVWFIHIHISVEVSAGLHLWGPPLAGIVSVNIKVATIDIHFGEGQAKHDPLNLDQFFSLVLQASSKQGRQQVPQKKVKLITKEAETGDFDRKGDNVGHTFLAQSGLMYGSENPNREQNASWVVRGGTFSFVVGCKMAVDDATLVGDDKAKLDSVTSGATGKIYAKPMKITDNLASHLTVHITQPEAPRKWRMNPEYKMVPTGLWQRYDSSQDPGSGDNNIDNLLDEKDGGMQLMTGVLFAAPSPVMSKDKLQVFDIIDSSLMEIRSERGFPLPEKCHPDWDPAPRADDEDAWDAVHRKWGTPAWNADKTGDPPPDVQTQFVKSWINAFSWDQKLSDIAKMPELLKKRFNQLYVAAPMMTPL